MMHTGLFGEDEVEVIGVEEFGEVGEHLWRVVLAHVSVVLVHGREPLFGDPVVAGTIVVATVVVERRGFCSYRMTWVPTDRW